MSYLSPQAGEIVADNHLQPIDMNRKDWFSALGASLPDQSMQAGQGAGWMNRRPPGLRAATKA
ncbi:hypothetical protein D3218_11360 [Aureimonas flava]|uniref:Uncharacterized protein n=1 Tax=Aureimonas flava TaxID=2320271 RepID=A0A3A1WJ08_9HYPH|nr:hypothetical protein [Aureimonas flava]RIY00983.1 hypothetical protein D3218_11360 [Aureimonas flava]